MLLVVILFLFVFRKPAAAEVRVATVDQTGSASGRAAVLNASGYVTARRQATVSSKVTGKVTEVHIEEGMRVTRGQLLARLDASIQGAAWRLDLAQERAVASALEETRVRIAEAKLDLERMEKLSSEEVSSKADLDRARAEVDSLVARLAAQQDQLAVARRQVDLRRQDVTDTEIRAPFDGIVVSKDAQPGEMISPVSAGSGFTRTGICTLVDMESLEIEVDVNEAYINRVRVNQQVEAVLDAYPDWKIPAHVITVIPTADRQKATVRVRIAIDQRDPRILPDMGVKVSFIAQDDGTTAAKPTLTMPRTARMSTISYGETSPVGREAHADDAPHGAAPRRRERRRVRRNGRQSRTPRDHGRNAAGRAHRSRVRSLGRRARRGRRARNSRRWRSSHHCKGEIDALRRRHTGHSPRSRKALPPRR
ncbi:MAG: efflux RND transporter periplasmic adaptor subunit [Thermoanaerobaculia bacterium]